MGSLPPRVAKIGAQGVETLERDSILKEIFDNVDQFSKEFKFIDFGALKKDVLSPVIEGKFDPNTQIRGFLKMIEHTPAYKAAFKKIENPELKAQIKAFAANNTTLPKAFEVSANPSPAVQHHFSLLTAIKSLVLKGIELKEAIHYLFHPHHDLRLLHTKDLPIVYEDEAEKKLMEVYSDVPFENWGQTVKNTPKHTFLPTTVLGVQNLVKFAIKSNFRVRCAGYRHSWSPSFSQDQEVLISWVNLQEVTTLPDPMSILEGTFSAQNEMKKIELMKEDTTAGKRLCRVGTAVTAEDFRRWALANKEWTMAVDAVLVEVTYGGLVGTICHGAGRGTGTVSDYVKAIEYVDCHGKAQKIDNPEFIKAAAGNFGLLGVMTHFWFELESMTYAEMAPLKVDIGLAVPPLHKDDVPTALRASWYQATDSEKQLADAVADFEKRATDDSYSEWFWFTYQQKAWVNTWNTTTNSEGSVNYPDDGNVFLQWVQGWLGGVLTAHPFFNALPGYWQAQLLATIGMAALPPTLGEEKTPRIKMALPNAQHFRRGVQNMRVRNLELHIPLQPRADDPNKPDYTNIRKAWWEAINLVYKEQDGPDNSTPMRLALEMRITGGSEVSMASQYGNKLGTACIEVVSVPDAVSDNEWAGFTQKIADMWMSNSPAVNVRPHWGKEWAALKFRGMDARQYMKEVAYKDQIADWKKIMVLLGKEQGWEVEELQKRFSNELWDKIIFE